MAQSRCVSGFTGVFAGLAGACWGWEGSWGPGWDPALPRSPHGGWGCPILCRLLPCPCLFGSMRVRSLLGLSTRASSALGGLSGSQVVVGLHTGFLGQ